MRFRTALACAVALVASLDAQAQQPPNDTDLKAAYCIGVTQQTITSMPAGMPESLTTTEQDRLQHLQAYLVPRMQYVDPLGLAAARARGQADERAIVGPNMVACGMKCFAPPVNDATASKQCMAACDAEHRLPRIWACNDLSWLPF